MKHASLVALTLLAALVQPGAALASERPVVMVVVEGAPIASELRALLTEQLRLTVISPTEAGTGAAPDAVLALRYSADTGLAISYSDRRGHAESLTLKAAKQNTLLDVAFGTAVAMVSRHVASLNLFGARPSDTELLAFDHDLHATAPRSVQLRVRDASSVRITALPLRVEDF